MKTLTIQLLKEEIKIKKEFIKVMENKQPLIINITATLTDNEEKPITLKHTIIWSNGETMETRGSQYKIKVDSKGDKFIRYNLHPTLSKVKIIINSLF